MIINEVIIKNFGKIKNKSYRFENGINIIYGENEAGKSTLHAFIKAMLFGMERGRGRAALSDEFVRYEPFENSNYYAGILKFQMGNRNFMLTRNFDKYHKSVELVCMDDGEILDAENGDLEVLLDGLTREVYDNTISISQLGVEPNGSLMASFNNYAASYYMTGDAYIDFEKATFILNEKKKQESKEIKAALLKREKKKEALESEMTYIWRDVHQLEEELETFEEEIEAKKGEKKKKQKSEIGYATDWRIHPIELLFFLVSTVLVFILIPRPWNYVSAVVVFLLGFIYTWNRIKVSKTQVKTEPEKILENIAKTNDALPLEQLIWKKERVEEELQDKKQAYYNLREQLQDLDEMSELLIRQEEKRQGINQAQTTLVALSKEMRSELERKLNERISQMICELTKGKYERVFFEQDMSLYVLTKEKKIPLFQLSEGTIQQMYYAMRIAFTEILFQEVYPFVFDETFVCFDDIRLSHVLRQLLGLKRQVLLFTCHKREQEMLKKAGASYHLITL